MPTEIPLVPAPEYPPVSLATRLAGEDLTRDIIKVARVGNPTRYTGTTAEQIVKNSPGYIYAIVLESAPATATSITIRNSTQVVGVINVPASAPWTRYELGYWMDTDIRVQPNNTSLTFTVVWA